MMRRKLLFVSLCVLLMAGIAWAGFFSADVKIGHVAPPLHVLSGMKQLGVVDFTGLAGKTLMQKFLAQATARNRGPKGEEISLKIAVIEKGLKTNPFDVKQYNSVDSAKAGGAEAIVTCEIQSEGMKSRDYQQEVYKIDGKGNKSKYIAQCREVSVAVKAVMKVLNTSSDAVIFSKDIPESASQSACDDERGRLPSEGALVESAIKPIAGLMADEIIPYVEIVKYDLEKDKIVKKGKDLAEDGKYEDAIDQFRIALKADSLNYAANYDLGIMEEIFGDYENAKKHFSAADKLQSTKESKASLSRIEMRMATVKQLETLGMKLEPYVAAQKAVKVPKFIVKGDNKDRYFLLKDPVDGAVQQCQVAGGMKLDYSTKQNEWVKLKCIDGENEGWIKLELVKMED